MRAGIYTHFDQMENYIQSHHATKETHLDNMQERMDTYQAIVQTRLDAYDAKLDGYFQHQFHGGAPSS